MTRAIAALTCLIFLILPAVADTNSDVDEFMKRASYRASYEAMLSGHVNLPKWMATPDAIAESTTLKITEKVVDEKLQSVFEMCKPDQCDVTGLIVMFSPNGETAKGLLSDKDDVFFGNPSDSERAALLKIKNSD